MLCNVTNSYLFVNGPEIIKFKAKDSEIVATLNAVDDILDIHKYLKKKNNIIWNVWVY